MSSGSSTRTCSTAGTWSGTEPTCTIIDCSTPGVPVNGAVTYSSTTYGSTAAYSCYSGYIISSTGARTCGSAGTWSGATPTCMLVDCGALSDPVNGDVTTLPSTTFGSTATYSCSVGYSVFGSTTRACASTGTWSDTAPTCLIVDCGMLNNPAYGGVQYSAGTTHNSIATYSCFPSYKMNGGGSRRCQHTGKWTGNQPTCSVISTNVTSPPTVELLYLWPCLHIANKTFTGLSQEEIIQMLIADTKIEPSSTSQLRRKRESVKDSRISAKAIGWVTSGLFGAVFGLMCLLDLVTICRDRLEECCRSSC